MLNFDTREIDLFKDDWFLIGDMFDFICGACINEGTARIVYDFRLDPSYVVKIDKSAQFHNVTEFDVWSNLKNKFPEYAKFIAPCENISSCGRILLQKKTSPVKIDELPEKIPSFLADTKVENWGRYEDRIVCHDYANHFFYSKFNHKLVKAKWRHN